jgi:Co/Zn/Cd efflux system component
MSDCCGGQANTQRERNLLWLVLCLNAVMFMVEFIAGWLADSSGLLADSLDMLADTAVYGLSLYAVGKSLSHKARAALLNGSLQLVLGLLILLDIGKRIWLGSTPQVDIMTSIAALALLVNMLCFGLLYQFRRGDINLRASWICSRNDMLANVGVLMAAFLVSVLETSWPDWLIGALIALIVIHSATRIMVDAKHVMKHNKQVNNQCC